MGKLDNFYKYRSYFPHYDVIIGHIQQISILGISYQLTTIFHFFTVLNQAERLFGQLRSCLSSYLKCIEPMEVQLSIKNAFYRNKIVNFQ